MLGAGPCLGALRFLRSRNPRRALLLTVLLVGLVCTAVFCRGCVSDVALAGARPARALDQVAAQPRPRRRRQRGLRGAGAADTPAVADFGRRAHGPWHPDEDPLVARDTSKAFDADQWPGDNNTLVERCDGVVKHIGTLLAGRLSEHLKSQATVNILEAHRGYPVAVPKDGNGAAQRGLGKLDYWLSNGGAMATNHEQRSDFELTFQVRMMGELLRWRVKDPKSSQDQADSRHWYQEHLNTVTSAMYFWPDPEDFTIKDGHMSAPEQVYWSENHMVSYLVVQFLTRAWNATASTDGSWQPLTPERYAQLDFSEDHIIRLLTWLQSRLDHGFLEFNSATYAQISLRALLNLVDFTPPMSSGVTDVPDLHDLAAQCLRKLLGGMVAWVNDEGAWYPITGRDYAMNRMAPEHRRLGEEHDKLYKHMSLIWLLTGLGKNPVAAARENGEDLPFQADFRGTVELAISDFIRTDKELHEVLRKQRTDPTPLWQTGPMTLADYRPYLERQGLSKVIDQVPFFWAAGGYTHPATIHNSVEFMQPDNANLWWHSDFSALPVALEAASSFHGLLGNSILHAAPFLSATLQSNAYFRWLIQHTLGEKVVEAVHFLRAVQLAVGVQRANRAANELFKLREKPLFRPFPPYAPRDNSVLESRVSRPLSFITAGSELLDQTYHICKERSVVISSVSSKQQGLFGWQKVPVSAYIAREPAWTALLPIEDSPAVGLRTPYPESPPVILPATAQDKNILLVSYRSPIQAMFYGAVYFPRPGRALEHTGMDVVVEWPTRLSSPGPSTSLQWAFASYKSPKTGATSFLALGAEGLTVNSDANSMFPLVVTGRDQFDFLFVASTSDRVRSLGEFKRLCAQASISRDDTGRVITATVPTVLHFGHEVTPVAVHQRQRKRSKTTLSVTWPSESDSTVVESRRA